MNYAQININTLKSKNNTLGEFTFSAIYVLVFDKRGATFVSRITHVATRYHTRIKTPTPVTHKNAHKKRI